MSLDPLTYWRATFTSRASASGPKISRAYIIAIARKDIARANTLATPEIAALFRRQTGRPDARPLGTFIQITHPGRPHDLLTSSGHPVWIDRWTGSTA